MLIDEGLFYVEIKINKFNYQIIFYLNNTKKIKFNMI